CSRIASRPCVVDQSMSAIPPLCPMRSTTRSGRVDRDALAPALIGGNDLDVWLEPCPQTCSLTGEILDMDHADDKELRARPRGGFARGNGLDGAQQLVGERTTLVPSLKADAKSLDEGNQRVCADRVPHQGCRAHHSG
ncbi:MAG: hypothetical protein Q4G67_15690, partial [Actinomycetia bacterium]|nr:hypothetical protein [Actinomycetes bacterium]